MSATEVKESGFLSFKIKQKVNLVPECSYSTLYIMYNYYIQQYRFLNIGNWMKYISNVIISISIIHLLFHQVSCYHTLVISSSFFLLFFDEVIKTARTNC